MQTETTTDSKNEPSLERQIENAQALLAKLQGASDDAEAEAARWSTTFEREPTEQAFASKAVAAQKAANARAAVARQQHEVLKPLVAKAEQAEREAIKAKLDAANIEVRKMFEAAGDAFCDAIRMLDDAINVLAGQNEPRMQAQQRHVQNLLPLSLADIIKTLNEHQLAKYRGTPQDLPLKHVRIAFIDSSMGDARVVFEVNRSATFVSSNLW